MSDHAWTLEHLEAYAADGLELAERERLERHLAECAACAAGLTEVRALDQSLGSLFAQERPEPALEDRLIQAIRFGAARRPSRLPVVFKAAAASAAVLLVGLVGAWASQLVLDGGLPLPGTVSLGQIGKLKGAEQVYEIHPEARQRALLRNTAGAVDALDIDGLVDASRLKATERLGKEYNLQNEEEGLDPSKMVAYNLDRIENISVPGPEDLTQPVGIKSGDPDGGSRKAQDADHSSKLARAELLAAEARRDEAKQRLETATSLSSRAAVSQDDFREVKSTYERYKREAEVAQERYRHTALEATLDRRSGVGSKDQAGRGGETRSKMSIEAGGNGVQTAQTPPLIGKPISGKEEDKALKNKLETGQRFYSYTDNRPAASPVSSPSVPTVSFITPAPAPPAAQGRRSEAGEIAGGPQGKLEGRGGYFKPADALGPVTGERLEDAERRSGKGEGDQGKVTDGGTPAVPKPSEPQKEESKPGGGEPRGQSSGAGSAGQGQSGGNNQEKPPPVVVKKIIIRSGEIEFEIESFDSAVATITRLVGAIPNGFVATVNSEKLPNGKVRGSAVVRVPPEALDGLVLDLRKELGKTGELKGQRIGSQDITKQYTDLESRLRAARAMEVRLLEIIRTGKGEIKDLLQAEKELGVWRTKIEEIEGELRYYSNLVSLSTLTVTIYEKEIRAAAAVIETERINMGVEVEDVIKSLREAQKAATEAKGRITKSDLKQHAAGQLQAELHFEVAPDAAGPLQDRLRQLGVVTRLEVNRVTRTEGGTGRTDDLKTKRAEAQFIVSLYNVANIAPRETMQVQLAARDAEAAYKTILARVEKAGGRVVTSNLNRQRSEQTTGTVNFEVKSGEAESVLLHLRTEGEVLHLQSTENPDTQNVTRAKRGFQVTILSLYNAAAVPAHTTVQLNLATADAEESYRAALARVEKAGGRVVTSNLNRQRDDQTRGTLHFEVLATEADAILVDLRAFGEVLRLQSSENTAQNVARTKRAFQVEVWALGAVQPRETTSVQLATKDVPASFRTLQDVVSKAKGRMLNAQLNEQDQQNVTGTLDFEVRRGAEATVEAALARLGTTTARTVTRAADSESVTDTKVRFTAALRDVNRIPPRESITLAVVTQTVERDLATVTGLLGQVQGRVINSTVSHKRTGEVLAHLVFDIPLGQKNDLIEKVRSFGTVRVHNSSRNTEVAEHPLSMARVELVLEGVPPIVAKDDGVWPQVRKGLTTSAQWIGVSLMWAVVGLSVILPWALIVYGLTRLFLRFTRRGEPAATPTPTA